MTIWFDMDGTFVDLYGVDGWLNDLLTECARPYLEARPLLHLATFARLLHKAQAKGYKIGVVSWLAKNATAEFDAFTNHDATYIFVTNEIGLGGVSENALQRKFTDLQGWMNQYIAQKADEVILMVSGISVKVKG